MCVGTWYGIMLGVGAEDDTVVGFCGFGRVGVTLGPSTHRLSGNGEGGANKSREMVHVGVVVCRLRSRRCG